MATYQITTPDGKSTYEISEPENKGGQSNDQFGLGAFSGIDMGNLPNDTAKDPLSMKQSFIASLPNTTQGKYHALVKMGLPADVAPDGKTILVDGEPWGNMNDMGGFFNDIGNNLSRWTAHNLPLLAGIGSTLALGPEAGIPIQAAVAGIGAMGGSALQQTAGNAAGSQEGANVGEALWQGGINAMGPPVGALAGKVAETGLKMVQKPLELAMKHTGDGFEELSQVLWGLERGNTRDLLAQFKTGRPVSEIVNTVNADSSIPNKLAKQVFFNDQQQGIDSFARSYQKHLTNATNPTDRTTLDNIYQDLFPNINQNTLDALKKYNAGEILSPTYTADTAYRNIGSQISTALQKGEKDYFENRFGSALGNLYKSGKTQKLDLSQDYDTLITKLGPRNEANPTGINALLSDGSINPNYGSKAEREALKQFLGNFKPEIEGLRGVVGKGQFTVADLMKANPNSTMMVNGSPISMQSASNVLSEMPASRAYDIFRDAKAPLNQIFKAEGEAGGPIAEFRKSITNKIGTLNPELAKVNADYTKFMSLKQAMGDINPYTGIEKQLKGLYQSGTLQTYAADLDNLLNTKVLPQIEKLGAAQDLKELEYKTLQKGIDRFVTETKDINNLKNAHIDEIRKRYQAFDSVSSTPFLRQAQDHSIASEILNKPASWFKMKSIGFLLGGTVLHSPLAGLAVGVAAAKPTNQALLLKLAGKEGKFAAQQIGKNITKKTASTGGQLAIRALLSKAASQ